MSSTSNNPIWISFPRWLEESGIPQLLSEQCHPCAWVVFRKLIEIDCDVNLTPDFFFIRYERLSRWLGLSIMTVKDAVAELEAGGWIALHQEEEDEAECRIAVPIRSPLPEAEIRVRLNDGGVQTGNYLLRYFHDIGDLNRSQKVIFLYQMIFGLKFTPKIVEELEEIANTFDMAVIYQVFSEAHRKKSPHFSWIRNKLNKRSIEVDENK